MVNFILDRKKIKQIRKKNGLSQFNVANKLKIDWTTYNRKENGKCDFKLQEYVKLLEILEIEIE